MSKHLITTSLEETWPDEGELLFLGEWCKRYNRKDAWQSRNYLDAPFNWDRAEKIEEAILYCDKVFDEMIQVLSEQLNLVHGEKHPPQYYLRLLGPWLRSFIDQLYDKYLSIIAASERFPGLDTHTLPKGQHVIPSDFRSYLGWSCDRDEYAYQMYSDIIQELDLPNVKRPLNSPLQQTTHYSYVSKKHERFHRFSTFLLQPLRSLSKTAPRAYLVQAGLSVKDLRSRRALLRKLPRNIFFDDFQYRIPTSLRIDHELRESLDATVRGDSFRKLTRALVFKHIPILYLESYQDFRKKVIARCGAAPKLFFSANSFTTNSVFRFFTAENLASSKLVYMQHGGAYGTERIHSWEDLEIKTSDAYCSYGWGKERGAIPLPHPKFSPFPKKRPVPEKAQRIVFLSNCFSRHVFRLQFKPLSSAVLKSYISDAILFLGALPSDAPLYLRHYPGDDFGWKIPDRIRDAGITFETSLAKNLEEEVLSSDLVIIDHLGTSYLECLAKNVPTLILSSREYFYARDSAAPYFDALEKCGILHFDPLSAAEKTKSVIEDLNTWWNSDEVQEARSLFVSQFASFDPNWARTWSTLIEQYSTVTDSTETDSTVTNSTGTNSTGKSSQDICKSPQRKFAQ